MKVDLVEFAAAYAEDLIGYIAMGDRWTSFVEYETKLEGGDFFGATNIPKDFEDLPYEAMCAFNEIVFECAMCGWYHDIGEAEDSEGKCDGDVCGQCYEYEIKEDEDED